MSRKKFAAQEFKKGKAVAMLSILGITGIQFAVYAGIGIAGIVGAAFFHTIITAYK